MIPYEGLQIKLYRHKDLLKGCAGIPRVKGIMWVLKNLHVKTILLDQSLVYSFRF